MAKTSTKNVRYEEMLPHEVIAARQACPLAYLPLGTIEWHGTQNPFGVDTICAHELSIRAAQKSGGVAMPPLWWGEPREFMHIEANPDTRDEVQDAMKLLRANYRPGFMGGKTIEEQAHFYNDLLFHCYHQIESHGFKAILVVCGHFPLKNFVEFTAQIFMRESAVKVESCLPPLLIKDLADKLGGKIGDHGARWETSLMLALRPELVDLSRLPRKGLPAGVDGEDPRHASAEFGQRCIDAIVEKMAARAGTLIQAALKGNAN